MANPIKEALNIGRSLVRGAGEAAGAKPFYSPIDQAIAAITQNKGTGEQMLAQLLKSKGVAKELKDRPAVKAALMQPKVTKEQLQKVAADNPPPQIFERVDKGPSSGRYEIEHNSNTDRYEVLDDSGNASKSFHDYEDAEDYVKKLSEGTTQFDDYQLGGGQNYREIKIMLPKREGVEDFYKKEHFPESNILAHARVSDRTAPTYTNEGIDDIQRRLQEGLKIHDPKTLGSGASIWGVKNGVITPLEAAQISHARGWRNDTTGAVNKILHIEEIQSDWHQAARDIRKKEIGRLVKSGMSKEDAARQVPIDYGYQKAATKKLSGVVEEQLSEFGFAPEYQVKWSDGTFSGGYGSPQAAARRLAEGKTDAITKGVPDAPFKDNWHELVLKRMLDDAVKNGYNKVVISPGAVQVGRYEDEFRSVVDNLSIAHRPKDVLGERISVSAEKDGVDTFYYDYEKTKDGWLSIQPIKGQRRTLEETVGKDILKKFESDANYNKTVGQGNSLSRLHDFSGDDLTIGGEGMKGFYDDIIPSYLNNYGKQWGATVGKFEIDPTGSIGNRNVSMPQPVQLHSFDITPQMRQSITEKGQPLNIIPAGIGAGMLAAQQEEVPEQPEMKRGGAVGMAGGGKAGAFKALVKQVTKKFSAPQDEALRLAQQRAALPVKQGGLGLPADNTPQMRADAMGFDIDAYKGMYPYDVRSSPSFGFKNGKFQQLDKFGEELLPVTEMVPELMSKMELGGKHAGFYGGKDVANRFAGYGTNSAVFPVKLNMGQNPLVKDASGQYAGRYQFERPAKDAGMLDDYRDFHGAFFRDSPSTGAILKNTTDEGTIFIPKSGEQVRSRFAAFDPFRRNAALAAALGVAAPDLLAEEKAKGGAVGMDAMRMALMNKKVQHKQVGGISRVRRMMAGAPNKTTNIIKEGGGNWFAGGVENDLKGFKKNELSLDDLALARSRIAEYKGGDPERVAGQTRRVNEYESNALTNKFIEKQLTKYIKNQMGTREDPIRLAADAFPVQKAKLLTAKQVQIDKATADMERAQQSRGFTPEMMTRSQARIRALEKEKELIERREGMHVKPYEIFVDPSKLMQKRIDAGMPAKGLGQTENAKNYEDMADRSINSSIASDWTKGSLYPEPLASNPWLHKVAPESKVHETTGYLGNLGFDHMMDELRNATNAASGLPKDLLIDPKDLSKWTMAQAAEHVDKINAYRASQKAEADAVKANNAATVLHKDYPEKGMRWVELKTPEGQKPADWDSYTPAEQKNYLSLPNKQGEEQLADALKYEGETMGHCVGGYCPDVISGKSRIYSLRDASGKPHATVEVQPDDTPLFNKLPDELQLELHDRAHKMHPELKSGGWPYGIRDDADAYRKTIDTLMQEPKYQNILQNAPPDNQRIAQIKGPGNAAPSKENLPYIQDFVRSGNYSDVGDIRNTGLVRRMDVPADERHLFPANTDYITIDELKKIREGKPWTLIDRDAELNIDPNILPPIGEGMKDGGVAHLDKGGTPETLEQELQRYLRMLRVNAIGGIDPYGSSAVGRLGINIPLSKNVSIEPYVSGSAYKPENNNGIYNGTGGANLNIRFNNGGAVNMDAMRLAVMNKQIRK